MPLLSNGEEIIRQAPVVSSSGRRGTLFLTNARVVFEGTQATGIVSSRLRASDVITLFSVRLAELGGVHVVKPLVGAATLKLEMPSVNTRAVFKIEDAAGWSEEIRRAHASVMAAPPPAAAVGAIHTETRTVEREVVRVRCRYCGNLGDEREGQCARCGAAL